MACFQSSKDTDDPCQNKRAKLESESEKSTAVGTKEKPKSATATMPVRQDEHEDEENEAPLEKLKECGFTTNDLERLKEKGIVTLEGFRNTPKRFLLQIRGFSEVKVKKGLDFVNKYFAVGFASALAVHEKRSDLIYITTGSKELDKILNGGIETGSLTEVFGEARVGKSQISMMLAVTCQLPIDKGGAEGKCLYIDTENCFRSERILSIAERFDLNPTDVLDNIAIANANTTDQQQDLLIQACAILSETRYALVVVDSFTNLFRREYQGRSVLTERQNQMNTQLGILQKMAQEYGVAVVLTNQVMSNVDNSFLSFGGASSKIPVGGNILAHASQTRLQIRKGRGEIRICKIYDSPMLPEVEASYMITSGGIDDVKE